MHHSHVKVLWWGINVGQDQFVVGNDLTGQPEPTLAVPAIKIQRLVRFGIVGNGDGQGDVGCPFSPALYPVERALYY